MNVQQLRQSLKRQWLNYYRENRDWLVHLAVWVDDNGQRRPSASFILATLSVLEPRLTQLLPLIVDLNNSPERIILVLGLNVSPDDELDRLEAEAATPAKMLPARSSAYPMELTLTESKPTEDSSLPKPEVSDNLQARSPSQVAARQDETCSGTRGDNPREGFRT